MAASEEYRRQVALLVRTIPLVSEEACFALKGGTAINLFIRDMPRLSVDIDLTYLPVADRARSLAEIDAAMRRMAARIRAGIRGARVIEAPSAEKIITKLFVEEDGIRIRIEVTPVLRGCVYDPQRRPVSAAVEDQLGFAEIQVVSFADLYAGKLVAALDRQHPRDLFDVRDLLANEGIDDAIRKAFRDEYLFVWPNVLIAEIPQLGHATYVFAKPEDVRAFMKSYSRASREDIRRNRNNVATELGFVGRIVRGRRKKRWLNDVLKLAGEKADYVEVFE